MRFSPAPDVRRPFTPSGTRVIQLIAVMSAQLASRLRIPDRQFVVDVGRLGLESSSGERRRGGEGLVVEEGLHVDADLLVVVCLSGSPIVAGGPLRARPRPALTLRAFGARTFPKHKALPCGSLGKLRARTLHTMALTPGPNRHYQKPVTNRAARPLQKRGSYAEAAFIARQYRMLQRRNANVQLRAY
jgi:hypothetical protein